MNLQNSKQSTSRWEELPPNTDHGLVTVQKEAKDSKGAEVLLQTRRAPEPKLALALTGKLSGGFCLLHTAWKHSPVLLDHGASWDWKLTSQAPPSRTRLALRRKGCECNQSGTQRIGRQRKRERKNWKGEAENLREHITKSPSENWGKTWAIKSTEIKFYSKLLEKEIC
jgi:hypothetical protein